MFRYELEIKNKYFEAAKKYLFANIEMPKREENGEASICEEHGINCNGKFIKYSVLENGNRNEFTNEKDAENYLINLGYKLVRKTFPYGQEWENKEKKKKYEQKINEVNEHRKKREQLFDELNDIIFNNARERYYMRFGQIPESGRSYNFRDDFYEDGISCYEAVKIGEYYVANVKNPFTYWGYADTKKCYLVDGTLLNKNGSDNEPLLQNAKIIREINNFTDFNGILCEIFCDNEVDQHDN